MHYEDNSSAKKRSLMLKQVPLCDGKATGFQCAHYFECLIPPDVQNPDHLRKGETFRFCTLIQVKDSPMDLGDGGAEMPVACNRYHQSERPFVPSGGYEPLTPEQIKELEDRELAVDPDAVSDNE